MNTTSSAFVKLETIGALRGYAVSRSKRIRKRALDVLLTVPLLAFCAPLWLLIVLWIRCTSQGPALYRQERIGVRGTRFTLYKFRSMIAAPDRAHREYVRRWICEGDNAREADGAFKLAADARITRAGAFLRKYSLDELPQLLNVLRGEMSLVGPRPALSYELESYQAWDFQRLYALPGITGLWQVSGRNRLSFEQMIALDLEYIRSWSLRRDIVILLRTIPAVLHGTGH